MYFEALCNSGILLHLLFLWEDAFPILNARVWISALAELQTAVYKAFSQYAEQNVTTDLSTPTAGDLSFYSAWCCPALCWQPPLFLLHLQRDSLRRGKLIRWSICVLNSVIPFEQPGPLNALDGVTYHNGSSLFLIGGERADNMVSAPVERVALGKSFL